MDQENHYEIAEVQVSYTPKRNPIELPQIPTSRDAYNLFIAHWDDRHIALFEEFKILLLNRANRVLGIAKISQGGISHTVVDAKLVFGIAVKALASGLILCHNHPTNNLIPSKPDISLTEKLCSAGASLEIPVIDHLIISPYGYYSFADENHIISK